MLSIFLETKIKISRYYKASYKTTTTKTRRFPFEESLVQLARGTFEKGRVSIELLYKCHFVQNQPKRAKMLGLRGAQNLAVHLPTTSHCFLSCSHQKIRHAMWFIGPFIIGMWRCWSLLGLTSLTLSLCLPLLSLSLWFMFQESLALYRTQRDNVGSTGIIAGGLPRRPPSHYVMFPLSTPLVSSVSFFCLTAADGPSTL